MGSYMDWSNMDAYRDAFASYLRTGRPGPELRANLESTGSTGGYLVPPEMADQFATQLKSFGNLFADFTVINTPENSGVLYAPGRAIATAGSLLSEGTVEAENDASFTQTSFLGSASVALGAYSISSGMQQVSRQLVQDASVFSIDDVITAYAGEAIGRELSALSVTGTGTGQPTGVQTAITAGTAVTLGSTSGGKLALTAAHAVEVNGASTTEVAAGVLAPDSLANLVLSVDPAYYAGAKWYMNPVFYAKLLQVTDTAGQPLIRPNGPRMLHGFPIVLAPEVAPLTAITTGTGVVFGNLTAGMYYRSAAVEVLRLSERYADYLEWGFTVYHRADFQVRDARAFTGLVAQAT